MSAVPGGALRIAELVATYPPYRGGTGNVCAAQAVELARRGHHVEVFTADYGASTPDEPDQVLTHRRRPVFHVGNAPLIPAYARLPGFDVLHVHQPFIFGAELCALAKRCPMVTTFHNELRAEGLKGRLFAAYSATALPYALRRSDRIAVLSLDHADFVEPVRRERLRRPEVFDEVPNGVDPERFSPGPAPGLRDRYGIPHSATVALACAALDDAHRTKRVDLAIAAVANVSPEHAVHLLIVGDGPLRPVLEQQARAAGVADRVTFAGSVSTEIADHYRAADVLLLPSEIEAFPLVLLEAMATGIPVISTSVPGARVLLDDGVEGLKVLPADQRDLSRALDAFLSMPPERRQAMGRAGRDRVLGRYTWRRSVDALEASLRRAVG